MKERLEIKKDIFPLMIVSFFLAFNYFVLKALKETLLVTASDAGVEAIPFVKMWLLFPCSLLFLAAFTRFAAKKSLQFAVALAISSLLIFYAIFAFILFPENEKYHLHRLADAMNLLLPPGWKGLSAVVRYWSFSLFYVSAELWCTLIYSVVFWGYANAVMKLDDAKKYYPFLTLAGTSAAVLAGPFTIAVTGGRLFALPMFDQLAWAGSFTILSLAVLFNGVVALGVFLLFCPAVCKPPAESGTSHFARDIGNIFRSKYLLALAAVVFSYNLLINLTDVVWKNEVLEVYRDPKEFTSYLSFVTWLTGIVSTALTLFIARRSLTTLSWTITALLTPLIALLTGSVFFTSLFAKQFDILPISAAMVTFLGSLHICLSSAAKYTLFEPSKEMAFIPLPAEQKLNGKAAIDGLGSRLGRTTSAGIFQLLFLVFPSVSSCTPLIACLQAAFLAICIGGIIYLGKEMPLTQAKA